MALILPSPQTPLAKVPVLSEEDVNKQVDRYGIGFG